MTTIYTRAQLNALAAFTGDADFEDAFQSLASVEEIYLQPHDKRDLSWVGNSGTEHWVNLQALVDDATRKLKLVAIVSGGAGNVDIVHVQKNGTLANVVKSETVACVAGLNFFAVDSSSVTFDKTTWVGIKPTAGTLRYASRTNDTFNFATDGGTFANLGGFDISYWLGYETLSYLQRVVGVLPEDGFDLAQALIDFDTVQLPPGDVLLTDPIVVPVNKTIQGTRGKSRLVLSGGNVTGLDIHQAYGVTLRDFSVVGTLTAPNISTDTKITTDAHIESLNSMGTERGIYIRGGQVTDVLIDGVTVENIDGVGIDLFDLRSTTTTKTHGPTLSNITAKNNYLGMRFVEKGEYCLTNNFNAYNNLIGLALYGGNNYFSGGNLSHNRVGMVIGPSDNDAHSTISTYSFNHANLYGIYCYDILLGVHVIGCHSWFAPIKIDNSQGFQWHSGTIQSSAVTVIDSHAQLIDTLERTAATINISGTTKLEQRGRRKIDDGTILEPFLRIT